jgi:hypothetical protein
MNGIHTWRGIPVTELSREQLLEALHGAYHEISALRANSQRAFEMHKQAAMARHLAERTRDEEIRQAERERDEMLQRNIAVMMISNN